VYNQKLHTDCLAAVADRKTGVQKWQIKKASWVAAGLF
jgi:hypothetical protein